jgi:hypothetical protein
MATLTNAQSRAINSAGPNYNINLTAHETREDRMPCEQLAEGIIADFCAYTASEDLGGLTVYFKDQQLVAFYDYERFVGHVF